MEKMTSKILGQGAEAVIRFNGKFIIKDRIPKSYRLKILDEKIRKLRTRSEAKLLEKASQIINSPKPFFQPCIEGASIIKMPFIKGKRLSESLDLFPLSKQKQILSLIGKDVAKLHSANIIHGDLTTSNVILVDNSNKNRNKNSIQKNSTLTINNRSSERSEPNYGGAGGNNKNQFKIFFIDFGLGFISNKLEDKTVDLHLLKQALEAKHFKHWQKLWQEFEKAYNDNSESKKVLERLKAVEKRGRYKEKY